MLGFNLKIFLFSGNIKKDLRPQKQKASKILRHPINSAKIPGCYFFLPILSREIRVNL